MSGKNKSGYEDKQVKKISIFTPCYNEEDNVYELCMAVRKVMEKMPQYTYEHVLSDNASTDRTWEILKKLAQEDKRIKIIENERNFGPGRSGGYGFFQTTGDATITLACDFQEPPELIPEFIKKWEEGYKVVWGRKSSSDESKFMYSVRKLYYRIIKAFSDVKQYDQVTGFGLYDRKVIDLMKQANDPNPNFRYLITEFGFDVGLISYNQNKRRAGKSSYNFFRYFDTALSALVNTSFLPLKMAVYIGGLTSVFSFLFALIYLIMKLIFWDHFAMGMAPVVISVFFLGGVQLLFLGVLGEYIGEILARLKNRPLVVEKERINFGDGEENDEDFGTIQ